jgi:hypothetical protein
MAAFLFVPLASAQAADKGLVINAGKLMAQPFIDAQSSGTVKAKQPVTILDRKGGWASVESNGQKGWIRLLNLRLETNTALASGGGGSTNSRDRTATTGIKGMSKLALQKANPSYVEFDKLANYAVSASEGRSYGARSKLKEQQVQYLKKGSGK